MIKWGHVLFPAHTYRYKKLSSLDDVLADWQKKINRTTDYTFANKRPNRHLLIKPEANEAGNNARGQDSTDWPVYKPF